MGSAGKGSVAIVAVPLPAQGHLNQLLHLSLILSKHGLAVHYAGSATHNRQARDRIHGWDSDSLARIQFHDLPLPTIPAPSPNSKSTNKFPSHLLPALENTAHLRRPLASLLRSLSDESHRVVVIHDVLMSFAGAEATLLHNGEAYAYHCAPAYFFLANYWDQQGDKTLPMPSAQVLDVILASFEGSIPNEFWEFASRRTCDADVEVGALINSCRPVEGEFIDLLARQPTFRGKQIFAIGPINPIVLKEERGARRHECLQWLDRQPPASVLCVSFGTTSTFSNQQIEQLAEALKHSGQRFIWVLRGADRGDIFAKEETSQESRLSLDYDRQVEGVGVVIRGWAPQLEILAHSSIGGFMSHCGWNSCMESMSMGVPIIAWPMHSDQPWNALVVTEYLKVGVLVSEWVHREEMVSSVKIEESIKKIAVFDQGNEIRSRAKELGEAIRQAASEGGSSRAALSSFIAHITR